MGHNVSMIRMLGGAEIDGHGPIRSRAQRVVLAALVIEPDRVVTTDRLAELIWGDSQPENPSSSLHNHVSRLRKVLPEPSALFSEPAGYRLTVGADELDVAAFDACFDEACGLPIAERLAVLQTGLALWRGQPFVELEDDVDAAAMISRLCERQTTFDEMRAETMLALGRSQEAIAELERLRHTHPLRERTVELLMTAHIDAGRRGDALAVYRKLHDSLVESLGLDPNRRLQALELAILTDDERAIPANEGHSVRRSRAPLPAPASTFFGRRAELSRLAELLEQHRVVTVVGPGGVGKTRLTIRAAAHGPDSPTVAWVDLSAVLVGASVGEVIAGSMGLQPRSTSTDVERVIEAVGTRRQLLVLDNCEHLIAEVADFVDAAVAGAPGLRVLATSREPLAVDGERVMTLTPLDTAGDAVELFIDRARSVADDLQFTDQDRRLVAEICYRIDGLPLAIELAASRCNTVSLRSLAQTLDEPLSLERGRRRSAGDRHGSLRTLVDWSAKELDGDLQYVFESVSVFAGSFDAADAAEVLDRPVSHVSDVLRELAERSLITIERRSNAPWTYRYLATIRSYAVEAMNRRSQSAVTTERYLSWGLGLVESCHRHLLGADGARAEARILEAMDDLRRVHRHFVDTGDAERSLRLAANLDYTVLLHMRSEAMEWAMETAERFSSIECPATEAALATAVIASWMSGDLALASRYATRAGEVASRSDDPDAGMWAAQALGDMAQFNGDNEAGFAHFREGAEIAQGAKDDLRSVTSLAEAAMAAGYVRRFEEARELIAAYRQRLGDDGAPAIRAWVRYCEGEALADDDSERALAVLAESLELARRVDAPFVSGVAGLTYTSLQIRVGDPVAAVGGMIDLVELWRARGAWVQQWITMRTVVELLVILEDFGHAAVVLGAVLDSDSASEISGADATRLDDARVAIMTHLVDAHERIAEGAGCSRDQLVETVIGWLQEHLTAN